MLQIYESIKTTTFRAGDGYFVDIVESKMWKEAWLYNEAYSVKIMVFGLTPNETVERLLELVEANMSEYISYYKQKYER